MIEEKKKILRTHIAATRKSCDAFLLCLEIDALDEEVATTYLLDLIDKMEIQLAAAKDTLEEE